MTFRWLTGHGTGHDFVLLPDADGRTRGGPAVVAARGEMEWLG